MERPPLMTNNIFDKTDKGREEIATRALRMAPRLRTLLLLIDGKRDTAELMVKVAGLGLNEKSMVELLESGFIQLNGTASAPAVAEALAAAPDTRPAAVPESLAPAVSPDTRSAISPGAPDAPHVMPSPVPDADKPAGSTSQADIDAASIGILRDGETQFQALYNFFNETIRSSIGLRGFTMQLKVERASTIADFRLLRQPYLNAVLKAKGPEMEHSLRNRLDQLLALGG